MFAVLGVIFLAIWLFSAWHPEAPRMVHLLLAAGLMMLFAHFRYSIESRRRTLPDMPDEQRRNCALLRKDAPEEELASSSPKQLWPE